MNYRKRITVDPKILVGKPVVTGTRIPVELILKMLAEGMNIKEIIKGYPRLTKKKTSGSAPKKKQNLPASPNPSTVLNGVLQEQGQPLQMLI